jgi:IMP dehydrogenase
METKRETFKEIEYKTKKEEDGNKTLLLNDNYKDSLCFDDVLMLPRYSYTKSRKDISLSTNIGSRGRNLVLNIPLISSPMDTVTGEEMAINMALEGGLGIIHRFMSLEDQIMYVKNVKRYINYVFTNPYKIKPGESYIDLYDKYKVNSFIKVDDNNNILGIVTNRDYKNSYDAVNNLKYTKYENLYCLYYSKFNFDKIIANRKSDEFKIFMTECRNLMKKYNVEKCPIFECIYHLDSYSVYDENISKTRTLLGLVTMKSVEHYFNNSQQACLDYQGRLCVGCAVGIRDNYLQHVDELVNVGLDCVCVDVANGHNNYTIEAVRTIRNKYPNLIIMAGNVVTGEGYKNLYDAGADCIRIGIGNGSICSTRLETGIGYGQYSSIKDCYNMKIKYNLDGKIISDGGTLGKTGNKVKALAIGGDALILGRTLAGSIESPGSLITRNGKQMKYFRGMASTMANLSNQEKTCKKSKLECNFTAEGVDGFVEIKGSIREILHQINGGIRSGFSYLGVKDFEDLKKTRHLIQWVKSTPIGLSETGIRIKSF